MIANDFTASKESRKERFIIYKCLNIRTDTFLYGESERSIIFHNKTRFTSRMPEFWHQDNTFISTQFDVIRLL